MPTDSLRPVRVALIYPKFSERTGYIENGLTAALAREGAEVHLIASGLRPGERMPGKGDTFQGFYPEPRALGTSQYRGATVHRVPHARIGDSVLLRGLGTLLRKIRPDVVQITAISSPLALQASLAARRQGCAFFTGAHQARFAFLKTKRNRFGTETREVPAMWMFPRRLIARIVSARANRCYAVTEDTLRIAVDYFGVPESQVVLAPLGIDTDVFHPLNPIARDNVRTRFRQRLGIPMDAVLCVQSGALTEAKNPLLLARAVADLRRDGHPFASLFVGSGALGEAVGAEDGAWRLPYLDSPDLADAFWAADIAAWPRSYTISQSDAVACGLPIIVTNRAYKLELGAARIDYEEDDLQSLKARLLQLRDQRVRDSLALPCAHDVVRRFDWRVVARSRLDDYLRAIPPRSVVPRRS